VHLRLEQNAVLVEFRGVKNSIEHINDSGEPFVWTFNFIFVDVPHLAGVCGEVVRESSFMAKFRGEVDSCIFEINKEKGLIRISDFHLVDYFHVFNHIRLKLLVVLLPLEHVGLRVAFPG
jgi:hypothetical protein